MEVNVLKPNKQTFNKAIIVFDSFKIARSMFSKRRFFHDENIAKWWNSYA